MGLDSIIPIRYSSRFFVSGGGRVGQECLSMSIKYTGIDSSQSFIDICIEDGLVALKCDMCNLPFQDNSQDYITSIASFHHLDPSFVIFIHKQLTQLTLQDNRRDLNNPFFCLFYI